jgi:hypothetical protein
MRYFLILILLSLLAACGGGNGASTTDTLPLTGRTAILKLTAGGTPSANLAGVGITVTLPDGVTPALKSDGSVADTVAVVSGVAAPGTFLTPVYTPASGTTKGNLRLILASSIAAGFGAGEFATLTLNASAGSNPVAGDFTLADFNPIALNGATATGLTPAVASLLLQ